MRTSVRQIAQQFGQPQAARAEIAPGDFRHAYIHVGEGEDFGLAKIRVNPLRCAIHKIARVSGLFYEWTIWAAMRTSVRQIAQQFGQPQAARAEIAPGDFRHAYIHVGEGEDFGLAKIRVNPLRCAIHKIARVSGLFYEWTIWAAMRASVRQIAQQFGQPKAALVCYTPATGLVRL